MVKKFTKYQIEELIPLVEIRRETIEEDPYSADEFETTESLDILEWKLENNTMDFTKDEIKWLVEELEARINMANGNRGHGEDMQIMSFVNSMNNAIRKITT